MNALIDFLPVLLFFIAYRLGGIFIATAVTMATSVTLIIVAKLMKRPITQSQWLTMGMIISLGCATLWFQDAQYIKWKPTAVYWLLSATCLVTQLFSQKVLVERLMGAHLSLPTSVWQTLNICWMLFFGAMGALNIYVFSHYDTTVWVNFKLFGALGITAAFILIQGVWLSRYEIPTE